MKVALVNNYTVIATPTVASEEEIQAYAGTYQQVIDLTGFALDVQPNWIWTGSTFVPPQSYDQTEVICATIYDPMVAKLQRIQRRFIGENIVWGITQANKTRAVGEFMEPIERWFRRAAPYPTIEEIELAKIRLQNDPALAASLTPFVTIARLNWYKSEIIAALS